MAYGSDWIGYKLNTGAGTLLWAPHTVTSTVPLYAKRFEYLGQSEQKDILVVTPFIKNGSTTE